MVIMMVMCKTTVGWFKVGVLVALLSLVTPGWADGVAGGPRVNINTADAVTLAETLEGVGDARARSIVEYRETHGAFDSPDDLVEVKGIGPNVLERNRGRIATSD